MWTKEQRQEWNQKNPDRMAQLRKERKHAYYLRYRDRHRANYKRWRLANKEHLSELWYKWNLRSKYGLSWEKYQEMLTSQNGVCAVCHKLNSKGRRLAVDHNHRTGEVRGLLCDRCNRLVGTLEFHATILLQAMAYLDRKGE